MDLGERICKFRTEKHLSQGDLADALGVSRQSISKWETNGSVPELDKLVKLSRIFGVSLDALITGEETVSEEKTEQPTPQPVPQSEPRIIYVEKPVRQSFTGAQILGGILLFCSVLCLVLIAVLEKDVGMALALCLPAALCGVLCLVTKHPLLWIGWCGSGTWWVCTFVMFARWEAMVLVWCVGILLVILSLWYTVHLHNQGQIRVPVWGWLLLTGVLIFGAVLLLLNVLPPLEVQVTHHTVKEVITDASVP